MPEPLTWLITGASSGLGLQLALTASTHGDTVIATTRDPSKLLSYAESHPTLIAKRLDPSTATPSDLNTLLSETTPTYGPIDILVNNAGYILTGAIEEATDEDILSQFSVNMNAQIRVIRTIAPTMRARRTGVIANIGSIAGWAGYPAAGIYCASKAAVGVYTEALKAELAPFGIDVTCIEPGYFRTEFLTSGHKISTSGARIPELDVSTKGMKDALEGVSLHQPGDPVKGAEVMYEALTKTGRFRDLRGKGEGLPGRLALGRDAIAEIRESLRREGEMLERWGGVVGGTDCEDVKG